MLVVFRKTRCHLKMRAKSIEKAAERMKSATKHCIEQGSSSSSSSRSRRSIIFGDLRRFEETRNAVPGPDEFDNADLYSRFNYYIELKEKK